MTKTVELAVIVEKNKILRKELKSQINSIFTLKTIEFTSPSAAFRSVTVNTKPSVLIIGNNQNADKFLSLIQFCTMRLTNWTILVLDHLDSDESAAKAFSIGAHDVLRVPFSSQEFQARLLLRLKQFAQTQNNHNFIANDTLAEAGLTQTELAIMYILIAHQGKIVTRTQLAQQLNHPDWTYGDRKYDVHITNIRKKLRNNLKSKYMVISVRSVGYYTQETHNN